MTIPSHWPVLGICGYSGSGKTTLIESLIPRLIKKGLAVAVLKNDVHGLNVDKAGKDTDRFFKAGATVTAHDSTQTFLREPKSSDGGMRRTLERLLRDNDIVLVEGHKSTPLPAKFWLMPESGEPSPPEAGPMVAELARTDDRTGLVIRMIDSWLPEQMRRRPVRAGLLIGGRSARMGSPKQLLTYREKTWAERVAEAVQDSIPDLCLIGDGEAPPALAGLPRLIDAPKTSGPVAGMLSAMRWDSESLWFFVACDLPLLTGDAVKWLLDQRAPGRWAALPRREDSGQIEPLCAWYDPRLAPLLEEMDRPIRLLGHPKVVSPMIPPERLSAFESLNTPADIHRLSRA